MEKTMTVYGMVYFAILSLFTLILYGVDKWKAIHKRWRIPEKTLLFTAAIGGCFGAWIGMLVFHHKIKKPKFRYGIPVLCIIYGGLLVYFFTGVSS